MWAQDISDYVDSPRSNVGKPPLEDDYTDLPVSRQYKWSLRKKAVGKCVQCGSKRLYTKWHCESCNKKKIARHREWLKKHKNLVKKKQF